MSSKNTQAQKQDQQVQPTLKGATSDPVGTATPELIAQHLENYSRTGVIFRLFMLIFFVFSISLLPQLMVL